MIRVDISNCFIDNVSYFDIKEKEIYFYKEYPLNGKCGIYVTFNETKNAINRNDRIIHTTSLCNISLNLLDSGYRIFLHENDMYLEIKIGKVYGTNIEIKNGDNLLEMLMSNAFDDYFYSNI